MLTNQKTAPKTVQIRPETVSKKVPNQSQEVRVHGAIANQEAPDTSNWLTRNEASDLTGFSPQTLANYERRNILHPQTVYRRAKNNADHRVIVYDPKELNDLRRRNLPPLAAHEPGERVARVCEMFRDGKTKEDVIIELRLTFDTVNDFYDKWLDTTGANLVIMPSAKIEIEKLLGPFVDIPELVKRIIELKGSG